LSQVAALGLTASPGIPQAGGMAFSSDEFLKILIVELQNQDPLDPMENGEFLAQIVQMRSLEMTSKLSEGFSELLFQQEIGSAGALIGKLVSGFADSGVLVQGKVTGVLIADGQVRLVVNGQPMALANVMEIGEG